MKRNLSFLVTLIFALAAPAFGAVSVSTPSNGATVSSPFRLTADASSCSSQTVASMGYSLDSSSDTTIVNGASIDASVPAAEGEHTLHVKAWGNKGATCVTDVTIDVGGAAAASDGVTVSSPGNGSPVTSPFTVSASSSTCDGQPVSAMAYSIDNGADAPAVYGKSLDQTVTASAGEHTLHVKSWGNGGAGCVANLGVDVTGSGATPTSDAVSSGSSPDGISVSSPGVGATVGTSFELAASASSCSGQPVASMGYSLDSSANTTVVKSSSVAATISAAAGQHTLHVKSWGNGGAGCVANVAITVSGSTATAAVAPATGNDGISVSSPGNGATVASSFDVVASAGTCSGQPVTAMGYSLDNSSDTITQSGTQLNAPATAGSGSHTLHVKSWGDQGAGCAATVSINVGAGSSSGSGSSGPSIPSNAVSVSSIQTLGSWIEADDSGTSGTASGSMALVGSPTISGNSRQFNTSYSGGGGERYYMRFGDDTSSENFVYDAWVYLSSSASSVANLEMDMNQVMPNGQTVIYGFQCDGYNGVWDYTENAGSPTSYSDKWLHSSQPCNVQNWSKNAWHHVQVSYSRNSSGAVTYHAVWLDGKEQTIDATVPSAFALGWAPTLLTNLQVDGKTSGGSSTVYVDKLTVYRW